jgi:hypothetical protein
MEAEQSRSSNRSEPLPVSAKAKAPKVAGAHALLVDVVVAGVTLVRRAELARKP